MKKATYFGNYILNRISKRQTFSLPISKSFGILFFILIISYLLICDVGFSATLRGKITDQDTGLGLQNVTVTLGNSVTYTDNSGNYLINDIPQPGSYLFTNTANSYQDYAQKMVISNGENIKNLSLKSTGTYDGEADIEFEVTITAPETGYAHIKEIFKIDGCNETTVIMDIHYAYDTGISFENMIVTDEKGEPLPFELTRTDEGFVWYRLEIEPGNACVMNLEYDIHYVSICHNGDPTCIHAYISESYAIFENINHIAFIGHFVGSSAIRFILPPGWVRITPWERRGDYFIASNLDDIEYAAPGIGRLELLRESIRGNNVVIGIHEDANDFAPDPVNWPINIQSVMKGVYAADSLVLFDSSRSLVIGIPPLEAADSAYDSNYMPANKFPHLMTQLVLADDIEWTEGRFLSVGISDYFGEILLYFIYDRNLDRRNL